MLLLRNDRERLINIQRARDWENALTDQEYLEHFGHIRKATKAMKPNNDDKRDQNAKRVQNKASITLASQIVVPTPPLTEKPSSVRPIDGRRTSRPEWVNPMNINYATDVRRPSVAINQGIPLIFRKPENNSNAIPGESIHPKPQSSHRSRNIAKNQSNITAKSPSHVSRFNENHIRTKRLSMMTTSKPLEWSKKFGDQGRKIKEFRKLVKIKLSKVLPPPRPEDFIDVVSQVIEEMSSKLIPALTHLDSISKKLDISTVKAQLSDIKDWMNVVESNNKLFENFDVKHFLFTKNKKLQLHQARASWIEKHRKLCQNSFLNEKESLSSSEKVVDGCDTNENTDEPLKNVDRLGKSLFNIFFTLYSIPNIQSHNKSIDSLLWTLTSHSLDGEQDNNITVIKQLFDGFQRITLRNLKAQLSSISEKQVDRSSVSDNRDNLVIHSEAVDYLRSWHYKTTMEEKIFTEARRSRQQNENSSDDIVMTSSISNVASIIQTDNESSSMYIGSNTGSGITTDNTTKRTINPTKSKFPGPIFATQPIAKGAVAPVSNLFEATPPSNLPTSSGRRRVKKMLDEITVLHHIGMKEFFDITAWRKEFPTLQQIYEQTISDSKQQHPSSIVEDSYEEYSDFECTRDESIATNNQIGSLGNISQLTNSHKVISQQIDSARTVVSTRQRGILLAAIASDLVHSIILNLFVLAKHAWAGKQLEYPDVARVFGGAAFLLNTKTIVLIQRWLEANRRTDISFKVTNDAQIEMAIQKAYSFWPLLALKNCHIGEYDSRLVLRLVWPERKVVHDLFRNPTSFEPNINYI